MSKNKTIVKMENALVLISYETVVAIRVPGSPLQHTVFVTNKQWSRTTSKHINQFIVEHCRKDNPLSDSGKVPARIHFIAQEELDKTFENQ